MCDYYITDKGAAEVLYRMKLMKSYVNYNPPNKLDDGTEIYGKVTVNGELSKRCIEDCKLMEVES